MHISVKYLILLTGFVTAYIACCHSSFTTGAGIAAAGVLISYALIEIQDLKTSNDKEA